MAREVVGEFCQRRNTLYVYFILKSSHQFLCLPNSGSLVNNSGSLTLDFSLDSSNGNKLKNSILVLHCLLSHLFCCLKETCFFVL